MASKLPAPRARGAIGGPVRPGSGLGPRQARMTGSKSVPATNAANASAHKGNVQGSKAR